jgi:hypothetical protein
LSEPTDEAGPRFFYRRVHPGQWNRRTGKVSDAAFIEEPGEGLSLFREDLQSPRGALQHAIDEAKRRLETGTTEEQERARRQIAKNGETVEDWVQNGWGVVKVPIAEFEEREYTFDEPDSAGHLNAFGQHSLNAMDLRDLAVPVPIDPCEP